MAKYWSLLFGGVMLACLGLFIVAPMVPGWWVPEGVSEHASSVDRLFYFILVVTGFFFVLTEAILCVFMWKYAACPCDEKKDAAEEAAATPPQPGVFAKLFQPVTKILHNQHRVEMAWTIVPAAILLYIAFAQVGAWADIKYKSRNPLMKEKSRTDYTQIDVSARQFEWRMRYPGFERFEGWSKERLERRKSKLEAELTKAKSKDAKKAEVKEEIKSLEQRIKGIEQRITTFDAAAVEADFQSFARRPQRDDLRDIPNHLHVVKGQQVVAHLSTRDVIHSFNLPHFRIKQYALPGKQIAVWFIPTKANCRRNPDTREWEDGVNPKTGKHEPGYTWEIACAELCGWGHYRMIGRVFVHETEDDLLAWLEHTDKKMNAKK